MPLTILPPGSSFGSEFGRALGVGIGSGVQKGVERGLENKEKDIDLLKKNKELEQENEDIFKATGIKLQGINDPKLRQQKFIEEIKRQRPETGAQRIAREAEEEKLNYYRQKNKSLQGLIGEDEQNISEINEIPEEQDNIPSFSNEKSVTDYLMGFDEEPKEQNLTAKSRRQEKKSPPLIPDKKINQAIASGNKDLAQIWQRRNEEIRTQMRHDEDIFRKEKTAQSKEVSESYKENEPFINKSYDQYEDALRRESILDRMGQLEDKGELSDSGVINFLKTIGFEPEWLKNPANEEYSKLGLDLLGGGTLQADYGSRVLQSEFMTSMKRIPELSQTPEGRRQIRENIKTMLLPSKLKRERLQFYLDRQERTGQPLPHNLRGKILQDIKPQLEEAYDQFKQRNGRYKVKNGTPIDDNAISKYFSISNGDIKMAERMMKEDGYNVSE